MMKRSGTLHAAGFGNTADVVAAEVDQHQVFGALLRIGQQLGFEGLILLGVLPRGRVPAIGRTVTWPFCMAHQNFR
jgi:hypothetical protein